MQRRARPIATHCACSWPMLRDGHGSLSIHAAVATEAASGSVWRDRHQLVVTATAAPAEAPVGAVVSALDGVPAAQRLTDAMRLASGSTQWKETRALREIGSVRPALL